MDKDQYATGNNKGFLRLKRLFVGSRFHNLTQVRDIIRLRDLRDKEKAW